MGMYEGKLAYHDQNQIDRAIGFMYCFHHSVTLPSDNTCCKDVATVPQYGVTNATLCYDWNKGLSATKRCKLTRVRFAVRSLQVSLLTTKKAIIFIRTPSGSKNRYRSPEWDDVRSTTSHIYAGEDRRQQ